MPRLSRVQLPSKFAAALLLAGAAFWGGCSEDGNSGFMEVEPQNQAIDVFDDLIMNGGDVREAFFEITGEMAHPEVRGSWTVLNREVFVDMYLIRASDYDPDLLPPDQPNIFWSSVPLEGPEFGDRRGTQIILHPCVYNTADPPQCRPEGQWVVLFYNNNPATVAKRTSISATVNLRFFK